MTTFTIRDKESGNVIESGLSEIEVKQRLQELEDEDKADGSFTIDFYEIVEDKMESNALTVQNLIAIFRRENSELETKYFRTQTRFDDYIASFCKEGGYVEKELTEDQLAEQAFNFLEYDYNA